MREMEEVEGPIRHLRMLLVGCGYIGNVHASTAEMIDGISFVGVVDINPPAAARLAEKLRVPAFGDIESAIVEVRPDVVVICTPTFAHLDAVRVSAKYGVNILLEKPIALSMEDAVEIKRLVQRDGVLLMVAHVTRFWPEYEYALDLSRRNVHGRILNVELRRLSARPGLNDWMMDGNRGGGAAIDLQIHDLDFLQQLLGAPAATRSSGREYRRGFNAMTTSFDFETGATASVATSFLMPDSFPFRMEYRIDYEHATVEMSSARPPGEQLVVYPEEGEPQIVVLPGEGPFSRQLKYFAECVRHSLPPDRAPIDDAISALGLCLATVSAAKARERDRALASEAISEG